MPSPGHRRTAADWRGHGLDHLAEIRQCPGCGARAVALPRAEDPRVGPPSSASGSTRRRANTTTAQMLVPLTARGRC
jgi:hypothetical protein